MQEVDGNKSEACEAHAQSKNQLLPSCEIVRGAVLTKLFFAFEEVDKKFVNASGQLPVVFGNSVP